MNDQVCRPTQFIGDQENCYSQTLNYVLAFGRPFYILYLGLKIDIDIFMICKKRGSTLGVKPLPPYVRFVRS